jgi:tetratricopeptide (TPR) repeat protein
VSEPTGECIIGGGTMKPDDPSYVKRRADDELFEALSRGEFCYVLTSRQMGKSSLMVRTAGRLREAGAAVARIDLTAIGQNLSAEQWYAGLIDRLGQDLGLEDELEAFWEEKAQIAPLLRWMRALSEVVLARRPGPIAIFVDEIDYVRSFREFSADEFFAAIRACYNRRPEDPAFDRLTFCLMGVATPSDLIRDPRTTPFNIGRRIELRDFSRDEAAALARGLGRDARTAGRLLERIYYWAGGHPYLTQGLCKAVAGDPTVADARGVDRLCSAQFLSSRRQEIDNNLMFVRKQLLESGAGAREEGEAAAILDLYKKLRSRGSIRDDETNPHINVLRLSGITRAMRGELRVRNRIYAKVFDRRWIRANLPGAERRRQFFASLRGAGYAGLLLIALGFVLVVYNQSRLEKSQKDQMAERSGQFRDDILRLSDSVGKRFDRPEYQEIARNVKVDFLKIFRESIERNIEKGIYSGPDHGYLRDDINLYILTAQSVDMLGAKQEAMEAYRWSLEAMERLAGGGPDSSRLDVERAVILHHIGAGHGSHNEDEKAEDFYEEALAIWEKLLESSPKDQVFLANKAREFGFIGDIYLKKGDVNEAREKYDESHRIRSRLADGPGSDVMMKLQLARSFDNLARTWRESGDLGRAQQDTENAVDIYNKLDDRARKSLDGSDELREYREDSARTIRYHGELLREWGDDLASRQDREGARGRYLQALARFEKAEELYQELARKDPHALNYECGRAWCKAARGLLSLELGQPDVADQLCGDAYRMFETLVERDRKSPEYQRQFARCCDYRARVQLELAGGSGDQGRLDSAKKHAEDASERLGKLVNAYPHNPQFLSDYGHSLTVLGLILEKRRQSGATGALDSAVEQLETAVEQSSDKASKVLEYNHRLNIARAERRRLALAASVPPRVAEEGAGGPGR